MCSLYWEHIKSQHTTLRENRRQGFAKNQPSLPLHNLGVFSFPAILQSIQREYALSSEVTRIQRTAIKTMISLSFGTFIPVPVAVSERHSSPVQIFVQKPVGHKSPISLAHCPWSIERITGKHQASHQTEGEERCSQSQIKIFHLCILLYNHHWGLA